MPYEPTNHEVLERVDLLAVKVDTLTVNVDALTSNVNALNATMDQRFQNMDQRFESMDQHFEELLTAINLFATNVDDRFTRVDKRLNNIEATMTTKEYLDEKMADLRGDLVILARKSNRKFESLVEELVQEGRLSPKAAKLILALEPFPQMA